MCGIAGIFDPSLKSYGQGVEGGGEAHPLRRDVGKMTSALHHRGPDAMGVWTQGPAALGCARLSILDLSEAGNQPMSLDGRLWIVHNGEIYNYVELRRQLEGRYQFRTGTDTEVILAAFDRWGEECLERFNGMFAFVIWDAKKRTAFGARDRLGIKPLYYCLHPESGRVAFGSEIRSLRTLDWCRVEVNPQMLFDFLLDRVSDHTAETMYDGVLQMKPGTKFRWSAEGGFSVSRYWEFLPAADGYVEDEAAVKSRFSELFEDAVALQLRADVPVGCMLSGGLDSSSLFCAASRKAKGLGREIYSFSTRTSPLTGENAMIDLFVKGREGFHREDFIADADFQADIEDLIRAQEEPFADGSMLAHFRLMREVRNSGVKVILSGQGGDEILDGYYSGIWYFLASLIRRGEVGKFVRGAAGFSERYGFSRRFVIFQALTRVGLRWMSDFYVESAFRMRAGWISSDFFEGCRRGREVKKAGWPKDPYLRYLKNLVSAFSLPGFLHYEDRNSMFFGVEARVPFLDHRLVEFLGGCSPKIKMKNCETKYLLRSSMRGLVPDQILDRHKKEAFPAPVGKWMKESRRFLDQVVEESRGVPFCRPEEVSRAVENFRKEGWGLAAPGDLWRMSTSILWYRWLAA